MTLRSTIIAGIVSTLAVSTWAQEPAGMSVTSVVAVGSRVRLRSTAVQARPRGLVVALDESALTLATEGGPLKIPLNSITALETSLGRKGNAIKGLAIGAVSGVLIGFTAPVDPNDCGYEPGTTRKNANFCSRGAALLGGVLVGGGMGAGIGALVKSERWAPVTLNLTTRQARDGRSAFAFVVGVRF